MVNKYYFSILFISFLFLIQSFLHGRELCRATLDCPPDYDGETVSVDYNVVMLSEIFEHCAPTHVVETDTNPDTISLFMIIDHSSSMSIMDPTSVRYKAACTLIDSIAKISPASEIGIAVFSNKLLHHYDDDPLFVQLTNSQGWNDSYVPFIRLDSQVGGMDASDKLKWAIEVDPAQKDNGNNYLLVNGNYNNSGRNAYTGTTDISLAFEAAKEAFQSAIYVKKRHYIVLFSDGIAQNVDAAREPYITDYIDGNNVPATLTAYFVNKGQPIPPEIKDMTNNIKNNGYSSTNIKSDVWRTQGEIDEFFGKILGNVIGGPIEFTSTPLSLTVNGVTTTQFDSVDAFYSPVFCALDKDGELTLDVSYTWHWNDPIDKDTTATYTVNIKQSNNPELESVNCWLQGRLNFVYNGTDIQVAQPDQLVLDIRFFPPDSGDFPPLPTPVKVTITTIDGTDKVDLTLTLENSGRWYEATFTREYANVNSSDTIIQNTMNDELIAIYRNPDIPLDTLRHAIPVQPLIEMGLNLAYYLDEDANGHPDKIGTVQAGGELLNAGECDIIKEYMKILSPRNVKYINSVDPALFGFTITIPQPEPGDRPPYTGLYYDKNSAIDEKVQIDKKQLPSGQTFPYTHIEIQDSMAPVVLNGVYCPAYIIKEGNIVFDTLVVTFSEPVVTPKNMRPFNFFDLDDSSREISMVLDYVEDKEDAVQRFLVKSIETNNNVPWYPENGDSLRINHEANVYDLLRNIQDNKQNCKGPLTVRPFHFEINVTICPNPLTPEDLEQTISIEGIEGEITGMIIMVKVIGSSLPPDIDLDGSLTIFDAVGNTISQLKGTAIDNDSQKDGIKETVVFNWQGKNSNNRNVSSGTYLGVVTIESDQGVKKRQDILLGVKTHISD